jgi:hypothetical protein
MSEGLSLGVNHQMLVDEYSPKAVDDSQALDDITERLAENTLDSGNEALVMIAAHAPEAIPTDLELETLLHRVREAVLGYMGGHSGETKVQVEGMDDPLLDIGLEDYKSVLLAAKDRVIKVIRWLAKQVVAGYKRLSDRLGRLSVRMMMVERKIDSSSDNALPSDTIVLPPSAAMLSLFAKKPSNPAEVMNAVAKVKWLFTTIHNDFNLFQNTFKRAVETGNRGDVLEMIKDFLGNLSNRLNARADSQRNGHMVFNQLPNNYVVEISIGDSFTDCWATINRIGSFSVVGEESRRPDRASLSRLIVELRNLLKIVNELYGKVGSRLTTDFRNLTREAERSLENTNTDNRTIEATINWFTEQQNRLFYRTMVLACGTMSAALDYCTVALRASQTGNEAFEDEEAEFGASNRVVEMDQYLSRSQTALTDASLSASLLGAALEAFEDGKYNPDFSVQQLMNADLEPLRLAGEQINYNHWMWMNQNMGDYPRNLVEMLKRVDRGLDEFGNQTLEEFKALLCARGNTNDKAKRVLTRHGYLGEAGYVQYLLNDGATPTCSAGVVEGAVVGAHNLAKLLEQFRRRTRLVSEALHDSDILVTQLYNVIGPAAPVVVPDMLLTGGFGVKQLMAGADRYGKVTITRAYLDTDMPYLRCKVPACDAETAATAQELIVKLTQMDDDLSAHWSEINQLVQHTRSIQNIIADGMAASNKGKVDEWLSDGVRYLNLMYTEVTWQSRLLRDLLMYREGLILSLCFYQDTMGGC